MSLGKKIAELRLKMGLNKTDLANVLGLSHVQIIRYERDESIPPTEKLKEIAEYFGVTTDYLLEDKRKKNSAKVNLTEKELDKLMQLPDDYKKKVFEYIDLLHHKYIGS